MRDLENNQKFSFLHTLKKQFLKLCKLIDLYNY